MEKKDLNIHDVGEVNLSSGYEKITSTALTIKEEMYSELLTEVNECTPENDIDRDLINSNETVPYPLQDNGQVSINVSETPFCFVGIKMENPDEYESEASCANSELNSSSVMYPSNQERQCYVNDQYLEESVSSKSSRIKMECEDDDEILKINNISMPIDLSKKCDSNLVLHRCDMGHSSTEFITGIDCQEYPMLRVEEKGRDNMVEQIASNKRNSVQIEEEKNQDDLIVSADVECNVEEFSYNMTPRSALTKEKHCAERKEVMQRTDGNAFHQENLNTKKYDSKNLVPGDSLFCDPLDTRNGYILSTKTLTSSTDGNNYADICSRKSFIKKIQLRTHTQTHTGQKQFLCVICQKSFGGKVSLENHIRSHTGEKPFQCEICQKSFSSEGNLQKHFKIHIGGKPFLCVICKKSFRWKNNLKDHLRSHSGEKPFQCQICKKYFKRKSNIKKHLQTHNGEK